MVGPESALWSRTLQQVQEGRGNTRPTPTPTPTPNPNPNPEQVQEGRGKSPFSAYVDSLTPLQNGMSPQP